MILLVNQNIDAIIIYVREKSPPPQKLFYLGLLNFSHLNPCKCHLQKIA
jgi:hypothetical protein